MSCHLTIRKLPPEEVLKRVSLSSFLALPLLSDLYRYVGWRVDWREGKGMRAALRLGILKSTFSFTAAAY